MKYLLKKLTHRSRWRKIFYERLTEPIHLNLLSAYMLLFGSYRQKIEYDLVVRPQYAYSILKAADYAAERGITTVSLVEFGVAAGAGLLNMGQIAERVTKETGIRFNIYGFDTGQGMPPARDYRDHPELYQLGDFGMNRKALEEALPSNTRLFLGDVEETVEEFLGILRSDEPIGFISLDVDYYHSAKSALRILEDEPDKYLPITLIYLDDIALEPHNTYCGELLAVREFNDDHEMRKIEYHRFLDVQRVFRKPQWVRQVYFLHVLDHISRAQINVSEKKRFIDNPYLEFEDNTENYSL